jgi:hypothetical protein
MRRTRRGVTWCLALAVLLAACGADEPAPIQEREPAVLDVRVAPGTADDGFTGARDDVTDLTCENLDGTWLTSGTVTNPTEGVVDYRIYSSLLDGQRRTLGVHQVDVTGVAPGEALPWEGSMRLDAADLRCVLRVERVSGGDDPA